MYLSELGFSIATYIMATFIEELLPPPPPSVTILVLCVASMSYVDTSAVYHIVRAQSVIKLYVIYNMLEVGFIDNTHWINGLFYPS